MSRNGFIRTIKQNIKKSGIYFWGYSLKERYWKRLVEKDIVSATKRLYRKKLNCELDLDNPQLLNEKVQYLKLNDYFNNPLITQLADKYEVRSYIEEKGLGFLLNDIYGVYDSVEELDWESLPQQCAIKCTFGAGRNIIVNDKAQFKESQVKRLLKHYLKVSFGYSNIQPHYLSMKKRYIIEKYIGTKEGEYPVDYKIFCMNGVPHFVEVCLTRKTGMQPVFFDVDWKFLDVATSKGDYDSQQLQVMKPSNYGKMLEYAAILSKDFKFVRVDFFEVDGKVYFSELTFTPAAGMSKTMTKEGQQMFGAAIEL